jgi:hypothetical protein
MTTSITGYCASAPFSGSGAYAAAGALRADAVYSRASDIVIQTQEGDRVTLSSSTYEAGGYRAYEAFAMGKNAAVRQYGESVWFESRRGLSLSVTGDLNEEELKDIHKILQTLDKMMNALANGDLEGALAGSAKFTGIDSIASFFADMRICASVAVGHCRTEDDQVAKWSDRLADQFVKRLDAKAASMEKLVKTLEKYFLEWFEARPSEVGGRDSGVKWASRFAQRMMDNLGMQ